MSFILKIGGIATAICLLAMPVFAHAESILSFDSDITVHKDSSVTVVETIDYDFGSIERHGIFRNIGTTHPEKASAWYLERYIDIQLNDVTMDGEAEPYVVSDESGEMTVKIGNPNATIHGNHTYTIMYTLRGALSYPVQSNAELYWNVTGNEWTVPILSTHATLHDPDSILLSERACYRGLKGEQGSCTTTDEADGSLFSTTDLGVGEGITFAQAIDLAKVATVKLERTALWWLIVPFSLLALGVAGVWVYRYRTFYKVNLPVIAQYEPYPGILPMYTGVLMDGRLDPRDITAGIVYLAEQGYIKIRKTEKKVFFFFEVDDHEITLLRDLYTDVPQFAIEVLTLLFTNLIVGTKVTLSSLKSDWSKQSENRQILSSLRKAVIKDLASLGFYQILFSPVMNPPILLYKPATWVVVILLILSGFATVLLPVFILAIAVLCIVFIAQRLTRKGYEAVNHLKGFKLFLSVTDTERFSFHKAPEKSPEQFMQYLPYAIAFGVEKEWAKAFEGITIPTPGWYDGGNSMVAFSAVNLTSSLSGFSSSLSSSSGASASTGGGSSGGGGGGGGGGSW